MGETLWWWLVARLCAMVLVGIFVTLGLWLLNVPLAFTLGYSPRYLGLCQTSVLLSRQCPPCSWRCCKAPQKAVYVAVFYLAIQILEGYLITPFLQQKAVRLPPAFVIAAQLILGALAGVMGLMLATSLAASLLVLVEKIYVEGRLGDASPEPVTLSSDSGTA